MQWQDHATLLAAVQADCPVTAAYFLPEANPRAPKLLVLGDQAGRLHVLATDGALLGSFPTGGWLEPARLAACCHNGSIAVSPMLSEPWRRPVLSKR